MDKKKLIDKIKSISDLTHEEQAELINLVNNTKKYGLVWEDKFEQIEEDLLTNLPVLTEAKERFIQGKPITKKVEDENLFSGEKQSEEPATDTFPNHILIEGDNLHALTALSFTHKGAIDVIYIDPPYNTGKPKEFKYNDKFVDAEDSYRDSKWISFMSKRLTIAHQLLKEDGLLFVSIDDNEVSQLNLLLNEIFNRSTNPKNSNQLGLLIWDLGTGTSAGHFTRTHEYVMAFTKNKSKLPNFSGGDGIIDDRAQKKLSSKNRAADYEFLPGTKFEAPDNFELIGSWGGTESTTLVEGRMICENGKLKERVVLRAAWTQKNQMDSFFAGEDTIDSKGQKVIEFYFRENGKLYCRKDRSKVNPPSVLREIATTKQGSKVLKNLFNGQEPISFAKPLALIQYFLELKKKDSVVLDFFAGSGTTLHATMQLNAEDGGNRQCILVTNNENNICEEVTYERNKRVIQGYTNAKGVEVEGLTNNNLRYYKCDYVPSAKTETNRRKLTEASTDLLCIKEDCYNEITQDFDLNPRQCRIFSNKRGKLMVVIYHSRQQEQVNERIIEFIESLGDISEKVRLYAFSPDAEVLLEEFYRVRDKIKAVPLPDAIYNAYRTTFKSMGLGKRKVKNDESSNSQEEAFNLFNQEDNTTE